MDKTTLLIKAMAQALDESDRIMVQMAKDLKVRLPNIQATLAWQSAKSLLDRSESAHMDNLDVLTDFRYYLKEKADESK